MFYAMPKLTGDKLTRLMRRLQHLTVLLLLLLLGLGLSPSPSPSSSSPSSSTSSFSSPSILCGASPSPSIVNPRTTLKCHVRSYTFRASKPPIINKNGDLVTCEGDVHVKSCWGRCDSSEIGDFKMPFKVSHHPVCTYTGRLSRTVRLSDCAGYPDPTVQVFDAAGCACRLCNSDFTSCENLNG